MLKCFKKQYKSYMSVKPATRIGQGIDLAEIDRVKIEIARHEKLRNAANRDAQRHAELAREWLVRWW